MIRPFSLQATVIVYQAVAEYWSNAQEPEYNLDVSLGLPGRSSPFKINFNRNNHYSTKTSKVRGNTHSYNNKNTKL